MLILLITGGGQGSGGTGGGGGGGTVTDVTSNDGSVKITNPTTTPDLSVGLGIVRFGTTAPSNTLGQNGDGFFLINNSDPTNNGSFYSRGGGVYTKVTQFNIS